jgi:predicted ATPase
MLRNLYIKNFKGWKDTGKIELAPITVLFGSNSSGKSSIGQFLVMLKQTVQQSDRKTVLMLNGTQASVDLGSISDILYNHDLGEDLQFSFSWDLDKKSEIENSLTKEQYNRIEFEDDIGVNNAEAQYFEVNKFTYHLYDDEKWQLSVGMEKQPEEKGNRNYVLVSKGTEFKRTKGRAWKLTEPVKYYGFSDAALSYYQNSDFLQDMNLHLEELFSRFFYLGPMRTKTKRIYTWSGINPESVGDNGEYTIPAILSAKNSGKKLRFSNTNYKLFEEVIGEALKRMELVEDYKIIKIENRQDYEVKVRIKGSDKFVSLPDVGFGVSQVLPVIVQLFYAPDNSVIFIEQPEIHLHPKAQSLLADIIIDAINMRESGKKRNVQIIIETHSEHLLRRLQRRISENIVQTTDIRAYFAKNGTKASKLEKLKVDSYGNILNWPKGFFGNMEKDMYEQSMNALNRRIEEREEANEQ